MLKKLLPILRKSHIPRCTRYMSVNLDINDTKINDAVTNIVFQRYGMLGGLTCYPAIGMTYYILDGPTNIISCMAIQTLFCAGTHFIIQYNVQHEILQRLKSNSMLKNLTNNKYYLHVSNSRKISLVSPNNKELTNLLDISFNPKDIEKKEKNLMFFQKNKINYFHLKDPYFHKIREIIGARSTRFRTNMKIVIFGFSLSLIEPFFISSPIFGIGIFYMTSSNNVLYFTKKLSEMIKEKDSLIDIIEPEYQHLYKFEKNNITLTVDFQGNLSIDNPWTFRKKLNISKDT